MWMSAEPKEPDFSEAYQSTRKSLIERLSDWQDQRSWEEFYKTYSRLIFSVAVKSGLRDDEAWDAVQETIFCIARQKKEGKYDPGKGSFKAWLMNLTRWRITDQFRKRKKDTAMMDFDSPDDSRRTAVLDRYEDPDGPDIEKVWDAEWNKNLIDRALESTKNIVSPKQFQIYYCHVIKDWPAAKVQQELGISFAQVYLAKNRVGGIMKKELKKLEKKPL
jgi:RNA polymerase sigma factor (sigma-70 family)